MLVLAGPTASGKTDLAVALAMELGAEVVSADSRQVYRRLDAGTAKPTAAQRKAVPHWLIDVAGPEETYDAGRFAREASAAVLDIRSRGKLPLVVGGTGLYLKALLEGLAPLPTRDDALRAKLAKRTPAELFEDLRRVDPEAAASIPAANVQRLTRALEVYELTGKPISAHWKEGRAGGEKAGLVLRLELSAERTKERVAARAERMWGPLLAEVKALVPKPYRGDEPGFSSLGYREALAAAAGVISPDEGLAQMVQSTVAYAKRQRTWFRGQLKDAVTLDAERPELLAAAALKAWKTREEQAQ